MYHADAAAAAAIVMNYLFDVTFDTTPFCHDILVTFEVFFSIKNYSLSTDGDSLLQCHSVYIDNLN